MYKFTMINSNLTRHSSSLFIYSFFVVIWSNLQNRIHVKTNYWSELKIDLWLFSSLEYISIIAHGQYIVFEQDLS